jgi:AcrR family transcriptional regulator
MTKTAAYANLPAMSEKKREAIERAISAARQLFLERPYHEVSMAEICEISRCSSATIYEIFGSKDGLYTEVRLKN